MTNNERIQFLRKEHGLTDEQIEVVTEDYWEEFWSVDQ